MPVSRGWGQHCCNMANQLPLRQARYQRQRSNMQKIEKGCLAIAFGCNKLSQYLTRLEKTTMESDHKPLQLILMKSLLAALSRLQMTILQVQKYSNEVNHKPGSQMYVADHLSRAELPEQNKTWGDFRFFARELEQINPLSHSKLNDDKETFLQKATE